MAYVVTVINNETKFWLKSTTWTFHIDRADKFNSEDEAKAAAKKAEKFMQPKIKKSYKVEIV